MLKPAYPAQSELEMATLEQQAIDHKLIGGRALYTDSKHLKANANKRHFELHPVRQTFAAYLAELSAAIDA